VSKARMMVDDIVKENRVVYGITTGFGKFARTVIEKDKLKYVLWMNWKEPKRLQSQSSM
jgi:histidine ammonia-lyase